MLISIDITRLWYTAGIPEEKMNYYAATQIGEQWCWAAAIQMVLNYYGVAIGQRQIVAKTYGIFPNGDLPDLPASFDRIHSNLNYWSHDNFGKCYSVKSDFYSGYPNAGWLVNELREERPVIVIKKVTEEAMHAVVITAVEYYVINGGVQINNIIVRDPWASDENILRRGRVELSGIEAALFQAFWPVRVSTPTLFAPLRFY
jgi:hypothetical protein